MQIPCKMWVNCGRDNLKAKSSIQKERQVCQLGPLMGQCYWNGKECHEELLACLAVLPMMTSAPTGN